MRALVLTALILAGCGNEDPPPGPTWNGLAVGSMCSGFGECAAAIGVVEDDGSGSAVCSTVPGGSNDASEPERCDGRDNSCSGRIDDVDRGRCDRCADAAPDICERCESADSAGIFPSCARGFCDCDRIVGPSVDGFICGCTGDLDCPCGFFCGEIPIGDGAFVAGCAAPGAL
ncbi:MAG: hypothetical protein AAF654_07030 [Myxococcota bacterium]